MTAPLHRLNVSVAQVTPANRVRESPRERVIRSRSGPVQRGIWIVLNENGRGY